MAIEYGDGSNSDTGRVIQVASTTKTNTFTTADASFVDITGLSVSITPKETTSKILILFGVFGSNSSSGSRWAVRMIKDTGSGTSAIAIGDAVGIEHKLQGHLKLLVVVVI